MALQYPWALALSSVVIGGDLAVLVLDGLQISPMVLGITLGYYSLWDAGIAPRNVCGVVSLFLVAGQLIWLLHRNPGLDFMLFLIIFLIGVIALLVFRRTRKRHQRTGHGATSDSGENDFIPAPDDASSAHRLFSLLFAIAAALSTQMLEFTCLPTSNWQEERRVWSWDEPPTHIFQPKVVEESQSEAEVEYSGAMVATPLAPGMRMVRIVGESVIRNGGVIYRDVCYIGVAQPVVALFFTILPVIWLVVWLRQVFVRRARVGNSAVAG